MRNKPLLEKSFFNCIAISWSFFALLITLLLMICQNVEYRTKTTFALPNYVLLLAGILVLFFLSFFYQKYREHIDSFFNNLPKQTLFFLTLVLFISQAYIFYNTYFETGWDSGAIVSYSRDIAAGTREGIDLVYYGNYPNNLLLTFIYSSLFKLNSLMGNIFADYYFVIIIQCLGACACGYFLFNIIKNISCPTYAYLAWIVFVFHIALNPWVAILYSDSTTLLIPMLLIFIYQKIQNNRFVIIKWGLMSAITYLGFKIKPQVLIVFIAIIIIDVLKTILNINTHKLFLAIKKYGTGILAFLLAMFLCNNIIFPSLKIDYNPKQEFGMSHFIMMGLNQEYNGVFCSDDVFFSQSFDNKTERNQENIKVAKERLQSMGFVGLLKHISKKVLVNYGNGTYSWGWEGHFYDGVLEEKSNMSRFLRSFYYPKGSRYDFYITFQHFIWLSVIFSSIGIVFYFLTANKKDNTILSIISLTLIGLTIFETIFEARARYLFIYSPFYIILSIFGWIGFVRAIKYIKSSRKFVKK